MPSSDGSNIRTDDGKISGFKFENVRAPPESNRLPTLGVRVRAKSFQEYDGFHFFRPDCAYRHIVCQLLFFFFLLRGKVQA